VAMSHETGGILLIILWMSYFLRPHSIGLLDLCENCFFTEERAKFDQFHRKIYRWRDSHGRFVTAY
jgi:hypothetical protein